MTTAPVDSIRVSSRHSPKCCPLQYHSIQRSHEVTCHTHVLCTYDMSTVTPANDSHQEVTGTPRELILLCINLFIGKLRGAGRETPAAPLRHRRGFPSGGSGLAPGAHALQPERSSAPRPGPSKVTLECVAVPGRRHLPSGSTGQWGRFKENNSRRTTLLEN